MKNFLHILFMPDNVPVAAMAPLFVTALLWAWWASRRRSAEPVDQDKVQTWPYLVRVELLAAMVVIAVLMIWSIVLDAPLEQAANPTVTPNPAKAPWYFLGLQELLVYFDPWIAGVIIPTLIIIGLAAIPYLDVNEEGAGRFSIRERPFAMTVFLFGFLILGIGLIFMGVFGRGPGWNFFWPWQYWDPNKVAAITNINLPEALGAETRATQFLVGAAIEFAWYFSAVPVYFLLRKRPTVQKLGLVRYGVISFLLLGMAAIVLKIVLRHLFNIKYVWVTPWFNF